MREGTYTLTVHVDDSPEEADARVRGALQDEGFGILSEIDVQAALQEKIGEDVGAYTILGACNPPLAHTALQADADVGALLPCNVVLRASDDGGTDVVAADPGAMLAIAEQPALKDVAADARERIVRALRTLEG